MNPAKLTPPATLAVGSATGNPRNKTALKPGRSLMDWVRLGHSGTDLAGTGGKLLEVTPQELAKHKKRNDCWMALKGKVYNVTPYMEFHPGGEDELLRGVGMDATDLFNEVHKWVNFESMLQKCLVGKLVEPRPFFLKPNFLPLSKSSKDNKQNGSKTVAVAATKESVSAATLGPPTNVPVKSPLVSPQTPSPLPSPKFDWFQTNTIVNIAIYTKWKHITKEHVVVVKKGEVVKVLCYIQDMVYTVHLSLHKPVTEDFVLKTGGSGKVDVLLTKAEAGTRWSSVGKTMPRNGEHVPSKSREIEYIECSIASKTRVTHDTKLIVVEVPRGCHVPVPVGYHVYLRLPGKDIVKPYTPVAATLNADINENEIGKKIHLLIKIYKDGALTPALDELGVGSGVDVSFPEGSFSHERVLAATATPAHAVLIAAGTGITPMVRVMLLALHNKKNVQLILFNKTEGDIPWRDELQALVADHSPLLTVEHVLSKADESWSGQRGHVRRDVLEALPPPAQTHVCVCGPAVFTKLAVSLLKEMGYSDDSYHAFLG